MTSRISITPVTASRPAVRYPHLYRRHDELLEGSVRVGPVDRLPVDAILARLPSLPVWPGAGHSGRITRNNGARAILDWLLTYPGEGWQDRWLAAGADEGLDWIDDVLADDPRSPVTKRDEVMRGLICLLLCRVMLPSYGFLTRYKSHNLFTYARQVFRPDLFVQLEQKGATLDARQGRIGESLAVICKIVLHTGREVDQLTAEDLLAYRAWVIQEYGRPKSAVALAWEMLREVTDMGVHATMREALRVGQRPTAELVDAYRLQCRPVRDLLIRYLEERRPALDYGTFRNLVGTLAGNFWALIEYQNPGIDTLHLPHEVAETWKQRLQVITGKDGSTRPRKDYFDLLLRVRAFYLDIREWALEDPSWVPWVVPCPVRRGEIIGMTKAKKMTTAAMHQRIRERLPHLPILVDTAERIRAEEATLLATARKTPIGATFYHGGRKFRRVAPKAYRDRQRTFGDRPPIQVEELATGEVLDVERTEDEAFWSWAVIETLRHTGVRVEELTEITHLALISYRLASTGEIVPMLQIVPSKSNEERLLLISPELASVLATIITRQRNQNNGTVALTARYDSHEKITGPPLPHLFQRRYGWKWDVLSYRTIQKLLNQTLARTSLRDAAGRPLHYTPHDFRRIFATESVTGGLPVHIVARLLGHANIDTTQAYMAVFDEELVRSYRAFLDKRRATRPEAEYREPTDEEWHEFQQHFQARKLELGECGRPYGTPCKHEHACIRCPSLRLAPEARPRLVEIIQNLKDRIQEARMNGWLGEVQGLQSSLAAATKKLVNLDRMRDRQPAGPVSLGMPIITDPA